jgi:hypothetical protein
VSRVEQDFYLCCVWAKLRRCFDHAEVELSNNIAENSMRPVALGRKNWLHVGSTQSGPKKSTLRFSKAPAAAQVFHAPGEPIQLGYDNSLDFGGVYQRQETL